MAAGSGIRHHRWNGGKGFTEKGYIRIWAGKHRGKYEHRLVMEQMLADPIGLCFVGCGGQIPSTMTVDHLDHVRTHNCQGNLMLLDKRIHDNISFSYMDTKYAVPSEDLYDYADF